MVLIIHPDGVAHWNGQHFRCALGRSGVSDAKYEGDGVTPVGIFPFREIFYRADRVTLPETSLPHHAIGPTDGWCDDPSDPRYNRHVTLPIGARHETLMRDDSLYDVLVVLGYNDDPVVPGQGSAIFMHVAAPDYAATEGCVALALDDLLAVIAAIGPDDVIDIRMPERDTGA